MPCTGYGQYTAKRGTSTDTPTLYSCASGTFSNAVRICLLHAMSRRRPSKGPDTFVTIPAQPYPTLSSLIQTAFGLLAVSCAATALSRTFGWASGVPHTRVGAGLHLSTQLHSAQVVQTPTLHQAIWPHSTAVASLKLCGICQHLCAL